VTPTQARELTPAWLPRERRPEIYAAVYERLQKLGDPRDGADSLGHFVLQEVRQRTRPMQQSGYSPDAPQFKVTKDLRDTLGVAKIPYHPGSFTSTQDRTWSTEEWDRRQKEAKKKQREKQRKTQSTAKAPAAPKITPDPRALDELWIGLTAEAIAAALQPGPAVTRVLLWLMAHTEGELCDALNFALFRRRWRQKDDHVWPALATRSVADADALVLSTVRQVLRDGDWVHDRDDLAAIARSLKVDPAKAWPGADGLEPWLELLSRDQLRDLAAEVLDTDVLPADDAKAETFIAALTANAWPADFGVPAVFRIEAQDSSTTKKGKKSK
jgi:hypothetical protein